MRKIPIEWVEQANGCWNCTSHKLNKSGYPGTSRGGTVRNISKFMYEECFGQVPKGMVVRHKCDNRLCINPEHLEIGTSKENSRDMVMRGRVQRGFDRYNHVLTPETLRIIRTSPQTKNSLQIAQELNVSHMAVWRARRGKTYAEANY